MIALAISLLLIISLIHLPIDDHLIRSGWRQSSWPNQPVLGLSDIEYKEQTEEMLITILGVIDRHKKEEKPSDQIQEIITPASQVQMDTTNHNIVEPLKSMPILDFAEEMPGITGGIGAYYIHIEYPEEAKDKGIEGRLMLLFVVEPDGSTSDIEILQPLHPLCDSAAVQALRKTSFIPGQQNGKPVRVRMRLPVLFRLIDPNIVDSTITTDRNVTHPLLSLGDEQKRENLQSVNY